METKEHITDAGVYIPRPLSSFPADPWAYTVNTAPVCDVDIEHGYPFLDKSFKARLMRALVYLGIFCLVFPLHKIRYGLRIVGRRNITRNKALFRNGALTVSNHVYRWDLLAVLQAIRWRRIYYPVRAELVKGRDRRLIRATGGIPIPGTLSAMHEFNKAFDEVHARKKWIHIFPEASRWDFYEPIRPFKRGAFKMALRYGIPVIPIAISYRAPGALRRALGMRDPLITISVGAPLPPELKAGESRNDAATRLCNEAHDAMCRMAGIRQNMWPAEWEE